MAATELLRDSDILQVVMCTTALAVMFRRRATRDFSALSLFIAVAVIADSIAVCALFFWKPLHIRPFAAYSLFFYSQWASAIAEFVLQLLILQNVFSNAMRPFPGLQRIGGIVFRWVSVVSLAVATALAAGPQLFMPNVPLTQALVEITSRLQQGMGVLILCLLIFVCFAIRPLGLTFRSNMFGVVLGLAVISTTDLVQAAWFATAGTQSVYSPIYLVNTVGICVGLGIWIVYFGLPEPERKMILLPTTSPFFFWNRISEILGDAPGSVAGAGFPPTMLPAVDSAMLTAATSHEAAAARDREAMETEELDSLPGFPELPSPQSPSFAISR